jgi:uncharacterized protein YbbK (DUF523 family)
MTTPNILISACLLGNPVRYNATDLFLEHPLITQWQQEGRLIPICPEVAGGLSVPRVPAEITSGDGVSVLQYKSKVLDKNHHDVTTAFIEGAQQALLLAQQKNCIAAILTEGSPSCGSQKIYDGSFSSIKKMGVGVTTALLEKNNIKVFNQYQLEQLEDYLR